MLQDRMQYVVNLKLYAMFLEFKNKDGSLYFPISELLFPVLLKVIFIMIHGMIKLIYKLRIALEIFKINKFKDKKEILDQMAANYNIKLIDYMADINNILLGDNEEWKLNLKNNKVICIIRNEREIYIRHPDKSYFE